MKRLISLSVLLLLILSTCDSPVGDFNSDSRNRAQPDQIISGVPPGTPPAQADSLRQAAWQQFKNLNGPDWRVTWNEQTGVPLTVYSGTSREAYRGGPEQAARSFLRQHAGLFGMRGDLSDLELDRTDTRDEVTHVRFQQTYKEIPVWEGDYLVHLGPDGRVVMANGHYYPSIDAPRSPGIAEAAARQTALDDLGGEVSLHGEIETELVVYPTDRENEFRLAWRVLVPANAPESGDWQYFISANNGEIIRKTDQFRSITGDGKIIEDHPGLTPNPVTRDFKHLDGTGFLEGTYAEVFNHSNSRAQSSSNSFQYDTSSTHFDEANVYWHMDRYRYNYLEIQLAFYGTFEGDTKLDAWVHDTREADRALYSPSAQELRFGNNYDFALEDKIIYHEINHAVADAEYGEFDVGDDEEGAIDEGNADYFAGSFTGRTLILDSLPFEDRDMANPDISSYNEYQNIENNQGSVDAHEGGEFWSAVLWDLRSNIGTYTTDLLVFDALGYLSSDPTFIEYRDAIMQADDYNYQGANNVEIMDTFAARGIGNPAPPINVSITGPGYISYYGGHQYEANVYWADGPVSYQWSIKWEGSYSWQDLGTSSIETVYVNNDNDFDIRVDVQDSENSDYSIRVVDVIVY